MHLKKNILSVMLLGLFALTLEAQCPDFMDLTGSQVVGTYGHIKMRINPEIKSIFDFQYEDFTLENYDPHPHIKADVAV